MNHAITYNQLNTLNKNKYLYIDLREHYHYTLFHLSYTINIPYSSLSNEIKYLDISKPIIFICYHGHLSKDAAKEFNNKHILSYYLEGGISPLIPPLDYY